MTPQDANLKYLKHAVDQTSLLLTDAGQKGAIPRTVKPDGSTYYITGEKFDWTEGFFPGTCWYLYEFTKDAKWKGEAEKLQKLYESHKDWSYHDLGFIFNCSYGNGYRLTGNESFKPVIIDAANSLAARFNPVVGAIKSWDIDKGWQVTRGWTYPVIIDNMMNLELLFEAHLITGDRKYYDIAVAHANTTMANHFRDDYSSYHVIDYNPETGMTVRKHTAQGFSHESSWARGQAWGLYGYVMCYRYTKDKNYLDMVEKIANYIINHPKMPEDDVPYWDYNAPDIPNAPRDASAAAITASAIIELDNYIPGKYYDYAAKLIDTLASPTYTADLGTNNYFILKHSVGSIPHKNEIDVPLNYADYYYVEALLRQKNRITKNK